jgi:hypothetical protein
MKKTAVALCCAIIATAAYAGPFDAFKGKVKPGMYETKMEMDMSGMAGIPPSMAKQNMTHQSCVTDKDIENGGWGSKDGKGPNDSCDIKNMKVSGNTATYTMDCKNPKMTADTKITFTGNGYVMDSNMTSEHGGQAMKMKQHVEGKYVGPCK